MFWRRISIDEMINFIKDEKINYDWKPEKPIMKDLELNSADYIQFMNGTIIIIESEYEVNKNYNIEKVKPIYWLGK